MYLFLSEQGDSRLWKTKTAPSPAPVMVQSCIHSDGILCKYVKEPLKWRVCVLVWPDCSLELFSIVHVCFLMSKRKRQQWPESLYTQVFLYTQVLVLVVGEVEVEGGSSYKIVYINQYPQFHGVMVSTLKSQWNTKYLDAGNNYFYHHLFYLINSIALNNGWTSLSIWNFKFNHIFSQSAQTCVDVEGFLTAHN